MTFAPGARIGPYEVVSPLGAGGMGEVYRARDARLGRDVAIKVLPTAFAADSQRMARFEREARLLASLNHPNVAALYGLEEADGGRALVMELVEGVTLGERLGRGPIALEEALPIAKQIAEAFEYAHEQGVIHRDLKPANVKVTVEGTVKVLDFGLAKALEEPATEQDVSNSPTLSAAATRAGVILGTAAYLSPEQAKGKAVDRRADIWAFGVVLYEMLAGRRPFSGEDASDTLAAVLRAQPDWEVLPAGLPPRMRRLLERCLTKDPKQRLQAIGEARIVLERALGGTADEAVAALRPVPFWRRALPWVLAAGLPLALWAPWRPPPRPVPTLRLSTELGVDASLIPDRGSAAILSPDGDLLAFVARKGADAQPQLYVRRLDQLQASPLSGTDGASSPVFSPDGQWIAFFADGNLKKVSVTGGAAVTLCDAPDHRGGSWADDGAIVFAPTGRAPLSRVSSAGGTAELVTALDPAAGEVTHRWPQVLPGGKTVVYTAHDDKAGFSPSIVVQTLPAGARKFVQSGGYYGRYLPSGHLVYMHEGTLFAAPFDPDRLEMTGEPVPALEGVTSDRGWGAAQFAFSGDGTLVYLAGAGTGSDVLIYWMGREGKMQPLRSVPANYNNLCISPDGRRLALDITDGQQQDVWIYEWGRDTMSRVTFDPSEDAHPVWTPDGRRIAFSSARADKATPNLYWQRADGTGEVQRLSESGNAHYPSSWHPTGKFLAFIEERTANPDIMILPMEGDEASGWKPGKPTVFLNSPFWEGEAAFSADGRWLAYTSNESGRLDVYVRPFPGPGGKWQISTGGGRFGTWSRNGKELFYETEEQKIMVAPYTVEGDSFRAEKPRLWCDGQLTNRGFRNFDLHPDGQRFAVLKAPDTEAEAKRNHVTLIFNIFDELRRIAPPSNR